MERNRQIPLRTKTEQKPLINQMFEPADGALELAFIRYLRSKCVLL